MKPDQLRKLAQEILNFPSCLGCEKIYDLTHPHCQSCGTQNSFDEQAFIKAEGKSLVEMIKEECEQGHPDGIASLRDDPALCAEMPFCRLCGTRVELS